MALKNLDCSRATLIGARKLAHRRGFARIIFFRRYAQAEKKIMRARPYPPMLIPASGRGWRGSLRYRRLGRLASVVSPRKAVLLTSLIFGFFVRSAPEKSFIIPPPILRHLTCWNILILLCHDETETIRIREATISEFPRI